MFCSAELPPQNEEVREGMREATKSMVMEITPVGTSSGLVSQDVRSCSMDASESMPMINGQEPSETPLFRMETMVRIEILVGTPQLLAFCPRTAQCPGCSQPMMYILPTPLRIPTNAKTGVIIRSV